MLSILFLLLGLLPAALLAETLPSVPVASAEKRVSVDDFCGSPPPAAALCAKTGARQCLCYLTTAEPPSEAFFFQEQDEPVALVAKRLRPTKRSLGMAVYLFPVTASVTVELVRPPRA